MSLTSLPGPAFSEIVFYVGDAPDLTRLWLTGDKALKWSSVEAFRFGNATPRFFNWPPFLSAHDVRPYEVSIGPGKNGFPTHWRNLDMTSLGNRVTNLALEVGTKLFGFPSPVRDLFPSLQHMRLKNMGYVRPSDLAHLPSTVTRIELQDLCFGDEDIWKAEPEPLDPSFNLASSSLDSTGEKPWYAPDTYWLTNESSSTLCPIDIVLETLPAHLEYLSMRGNYSLEKQRILPPPEPEEDEEDLEIEIGAPIQWPPTLLYLELEFYSRVRLNMFGLPFDSEIDDSNPQDASKANSQKIILPSLQTLKYMAVGLFADCTASPIEPDFWNHLPPSLTEMHLNLSSMEFERLEHEVALPTLDNMRTIKWPSGLKVFSWEHPEEAGEGYTEAFFNANPQLEECSFNRDWSGTMFNNRFSEHPPRTKTLYVHGENDDLADLPISVEFVHYLQYDEDLLARAYTGISNAIEREKEDYFAGLTSKKPAPLYPTLLQLSLKLLSMGLSGPDVLHCALPNTLTSLDLSSTALPRNCPPLPPLITTLTLHSRAIPIVPGVGLKLLPAGLKSLTFGPLDYGGPSHERIWEAIPLCPGAVGSPGIDETRRLPESLTYLDFEYRSINKQLAQWIDNLPSTLPLEALKLKGYRSSEEDCSWSLSFPPQLAHSETLTAIELRVYRCYPADLAFLPRKLRSLRLYAHPCEMKHLNEWNIDLIPQSLSHICFSFPTDTKPEDWILRGLPAPVKM